MNESLVGQGSIVSPKKITDLTNRILEKLGVPPRDASIVSKMLVQSDMRGVESHGVAHLRMFYARRIRLGIINTNPNIKIYSKSPSTAVVKRLLDSHK